MSALLSLRGLTKEFPARRGPWGTRTPLRAVDGVDLDVLRGECLALVGESGSGKTTLGRCAVRLIEPTAGAVRFDGEDLLALRGGELRRRRRRFQMVFQDPYGSLDPRFTIERTVAEPLLAQGMVAPRQRRAAAGALLERVGLPAALAGRYPHELSGGQRQRVAIARALAPGPDLLVADEPLSALDVSVQAQVLNLLAGLREEAGLTLLLVSHDLAVVARVADRVAVLYRGRLVELAAAGELFAAPLHPYTASLLAAVPRIAAAFAPRRRRASAGEAAAAPAADPASGVGCPFAPRCPAAGPRCAAEEPPLAPAAGERLVACFYPGAVGPPGAGVEPLGGRIVH